MVQLTDQESSEQSVLWSPISEDGSLALDVEPPAPPPPPPTSTAIPCPECPDAEVVSAPHAGEGWSLVGVIGLLLALVGFGAGWFINRRRTT